MYHLCRRSLSQVLECAQLTQAQPRSFPAETLLDTPLPINKQYKSDHREL